MDAVLKVTGRAQYASDHSFPGLVYGVPVCATVGKGKILSIDSAKAKAMPGVLSVLTHDNIGKLKRPKANDGFKSRVDEVRTPFEDNVIRYYGQYVAMVVAETFEIAQAAARSIQVKYAEEKPDIREKMEPEDLKKTDTERGKPDAAFAAAAFKVDQTYTTPNEYHNPIELHATVATWNLEGKKPTVTLYETSQAVLTHRNVLAQILSMDPEDVRVITHYLGSGFGGKLWAWPHSALAAVAAKQLRRPVKVVIDRTMAFTNVGHRPFTQQRIRIGADTKGKIQSIQHDYVSQGDRLGAFKENCGEVSGFLYGSPNVAVNSSIARRDMAVPTSMRGPGAIPGLFALESAMDELSVALKMDPLQLRLLNDTMVDGSNDKPFSSRHLKECLTLGAERFGWSKRTPGIASMRDGDAILGWGVAACTWPARTLDAEATAELKSDGILTIRCGTHDIGTGMYTAIGQVASDETGIPLDRIHVELGDTKLPPGPIAGGSMATGSIVPVVLQAVREIKSKIAKEAVEAPRSPFKGMKAEDLSLSGGQLKGPNVSVDFPTLFKTLKSRSFTGKGSAKGSMTQKGGQYSTKSFGAQFVEVAWQPQLARLSVRRVVSIMDGGHIINYQPAKNQIEGAIVMGLGMALFEEGVFDERYGQPINNNLADYIMPVHADMPDIDVVFLDYPDIELNEIGARGIGEIGLAGIASAITHAVYHATGIRVRDLPVKVEDLIKSSVV